MDINTLINDSSVLSNYIPQLLIGLAFVAIVGVAKKMWSLCGIAIIGMIVLVALFPQ